MDITDKNFEEKVIEQSKEKVVVVDFWAPWCMPCQMLGPVITKIVESYGDKVILAKLNVDENPEKANEYHINGIPAIKIFKDGKVVTEFTGMVPEPTIRGHIDKALEN